MIIAGHGRLLAAKAMGLAEVPTIELTGLNDAQRRALRLADNKIALGAGWDLDLLKLELGELSVLEFGMDLTVTGFSSGELDILLSSKEDPDDDAIPPIPAEPRSRPGDIWRLGDHRIGCGDSRDIGFLHKLVGDSATVDVAFLKTTRHQLNIALRRAPRRLRFRGSDRALLAWMTWLWPNLLGLARVVQPNTILRWHRAGFRAYWRWKSRGGPGRPKVCRELRDLILRMSTENPLWRR